MTPERWRQVKEILAAALQGNPSERPAYLDQACAEPALRRELESLIAAHEQGGSSFLERLGNQAMGGFSNAWRHNPGGGME